MMRADRRARDHARWQASTTSTTKSETRSNRVAVSVLLDRSPNTVSPSCPHEIHVVTPSPKAQEDNECHVRLTLTYSAPLSAYSARLTLAASRSADEPSVHHPAAPRHASSTASPARRTPSAAPLGSAARSSFAS